jgi:hypothetical protein
MGTGRSGVAKTGVSTVSFTNLSDRGTSLMAIMVPTRMSIFSSTSIVMVGFDRCDFHSFHSVLSSRDAPHRARPTQSWVREY